MLVRSDAYVSYAEGGGSISRTKEAMQRYMISEVKRAIDSEDDPDRKEKIRRRNLTETGELLNENRYNIDNHVWAETMERIDAYSIIGGAAVDNNKEMLYFDSENHEKSRETDVSIVFYGLDAAGIYLAQFHGTNPQVMEFADKLKRNIWLTAEEEYLLFDKFGISLSRISGHPYWVEVV